jgi:predicted nucleic acid-binding protein
MIAVSNTTPPRYLVAIDQHHLLGQLFEKVFVPSAVHEELTEARTPDMVRLRVLSLPAWYEVQMVSDRQEAFPVTLHRGERDAILLAEMIQPDVILIDEQIGRLVALGRNLPVSGTLGILERADLMSFISDFPKVLKQLKSCGFYLSDSLERQLLQRHHARQHAK